MSRVHRVSILVLLLSGFTIGWKYHDEEHWPSLCKSGKMQSPIDLETNEATPVFYTPFVWENYFTQAQARVKNNGHSAEVRLKLDAENVPEVKGGNLPNVYVLDHLHFHWHSEHTVDGSSYPLELHLVHHAKQYGNLTEALKDPQGVAVFGVLFDISPDDDNLLKPLISVMKSVKSNNDLREMDNFNVLYFLPRDTAGYFRYDGSLTTPGCNEGILWTVFTNTLPISKQQVEAFAEINDSEGKNLQENFRSLQEPNDRKILIKISPVRSRSSGSMMNTASVIVLIGSVYLFAIMY
ncbi:putative carbonic anhydrase 3 [Aethina tumida]|uniref:putative carbonic anhydrase 3 n=1 Tax=Aethina tumida TaxID=116153 RepID=UPI00096B1272|nr:putative carbonic anhydrase 3 [Aethina tumida]